VVQVRNSPQTNQNVITYDTVIAVDNSDLKLRPGMTANVHIITARKDGALKVPNGALRFHPIEPKSTNSTALAEKDPVEGGKDQAKDDHVVRKVYVPVKGADGNVDSLKSVSIETGINDGIYTQVLGGLKEGDEVVVDYKGLTEQSGASNPFGMRRF